MGIIVHIVDSSIRSDSERFSQHSTRVNGDVVIRTGAACNGIVQAISDARKATSPGTIDALIVYGHGAPGIQGVSMGKDGAGVKELSALTVKSLEVRAFDAELGALKRHFSSQGIIILRGCNTGEGREGEALIRKLSKIAGVSVKASNWYQIVGRTELAGNIITATPDGTVTEDSLTGLKNFGGLPLGEEILLLGAEFGDRLLRPFSPK